MSWGDGGAVQHFDLLPFFFFLLFLIHDGYMSPHLLVPRIFHPSPMSVKDLALSNASWFGQVLQSLPIGAFLGSQEKNMDFSQGFLAAGGQWQLNLGCTGYE